MLRTMTFLICGLAASAAFALPPNNAEMIFVRKSCSGFFASSVCVQSMADANAWLTTRTAASVSIDIGPGDWDGFECNGEDNVAVRGAGREVTRLIKHSSSFGAGDGVGMEIADCNRLDVESLTAHGDFAGVRWTGTGSSTWSDTDLIGGGAGGAGEYFSMGWYDSGCVSTRPEHSFFGTRVKA